MVDKSKLFSRAWEIARKAAKETGEKAVKFFREALKIVWAEIKNVKKEVKKTFRGYAEIQDEGDRKVATYKLWAKDGQRRIYMSYRKCNAYIILAGTERGHVEKLSNGYSVATMSKYKADHELMVTLAEDFFKVYSLDSCF